MNIKRDRKILEKHFKYDKEKSCFYPIRQTPVKGVTVNGEICIRTRKISIQLKKLIWLFETGEYPLFDLDYIDGNPKNCKFSNLKIVKHRGYNLTQDGTWQVRMSIDGKQIELGRFKLKSDAQRAYMIAVSKTKKRLLKEHLEYLEKKKTHLKGTSFNKHTKRWIAQIVVKGPKKYLGRFSTAQEAHEAYIKELNRRSKDA